jgi:hypothetical protein
VNRREKRPWIESLDWEYHPNVEVPAVIRKQMARELKANDDSSTDYSLDWITDGSTTSDASTLKSGMRVKFCLLELEADAKMLVG